jgi:hypothetical protein
VLQRHTLQDWKESPRQVLRSSESATARELLATYATGDIDTRFSPFWTYIYMTAPPRHKVHSTNNGLSGWQGPKCLPCLNLGLK